MSNANLYTLFLGQFPTDPAAVFLDGVDGRVLRYGEVGQRSGKVLSVLQRHGVTQGDRVVVQVDKSIEAVVLYLACLRAGAIYIPLNTAYTPSEVRYFLDNATPRLFVCAPGKREAMTAVADAAGVASVLSLGANGDGELSDAATEAPASDQVVEVADDDLDEDRALIANQVAQVAT